MTKILAFAGRKQSGKTSAANFIYGMEMMSVDLISGFKIDENGHLVVPRERNGVIEDAIFDPTNLAPQNLDFLMEKVWPFVKVYYMADGLKDICINVLGLTREQCYGSDDAKNSETHLKWEHMPAPHHVLPKTPKGRLGEYKRKTEGPMTAREVMQFVGTEIFRAMYPNVWVDSCVRRIQEEAKFYPDPERFALIGDVRFPNEVEGVQAAGGKVIRLTRNPFPEETHDSEVALDEDKFDWSKFDAIIDNSNMITHDKNMAIYEKLQEWNWLPYSIQSTGETITK